MSRNPQKRRSFPLTLLVAWRYLFSRKQKTVINIISWISLVGIAVSTAALIVVLSVYNGIGNLTQNLFNSFDPELLVQPAKGKTFKMSNTQLERLQQLEGVAAVSQMVEENAWITYRHNQAIVSLRGVDGEYPKVSGLDTLLYEGVYGLKIENGHAAQEGFAARRSNRASAEEASLLTGIENEAQEEEEVLAEPYSRYTYFLLFGAEVYYNLGIREASNVPVAVHIPKRGTALGMTMEQALNTGYAMPGGNFYIQQDIDNRYVVADIAFVRQLMNYDDNECTALAIALKPSLRAKGKAAAREAVEGMLGDGYTVKDRFQQQPIYYKVFRSERLGIYLILALIILIATLNLYSSLTLLVLDKRRDIATLRSLGMERGQMIGIFRLEGVMIATIGVVAGLLTGFIICLLQQRFGIVKMGDNFVVSAFPVAMRGVDFLITFLMVSGISALAVFAAVRGRKM
ncbi:MAG: ABC transporter permease [Bacteroidales bacterium]|nr:ABC transporter permease [Bacteroidales bacterium]